MEKKYVSCLLFCKTMLSYLLLCIVFFLVAGRQFDFGDYNIEESRGERTVGEIVDGTSVYRSFCYQGDYIHAVCVVAGTYARENKGKLSVALLNDQGAVISQSEKQLADIADNTAVEFIMDCVLEQESDVYRLKIWSDGCESGNAITLYYSREDEICIHVYGYKEHPWRGYFWHLACLGAVLWMLFYFYERQREQTEKKCFLHTVCSTLDTYRFLIRQLVARDFKTKYKRSVLGAFWSFLNPLCTMAVQYVVFSTIFKSSIRNYPVYLLSASVLFNFFTESVGGGLTAIVGNASLITKVYVPKYIYPVTKVLSTAVNLLVSMVPLFVVVCVTKEPLSAAYLLIPYMFVCLLLFCIGMSLFLSAMMVFFRDVQFLWGIISLLWMYATPMFYPQEIIPQRFQFVLDMNPMFHYISFFRTILLGHVSPQMGEYVACMAFSLAFCAGGALFFRHFQNKFALYL